ANKLQKTQTREQVEKGFWGRLVNMVMKRPLLFALPIVIIMILLIIPLGKLSLGGFSEKYLPPSNSVRMAQEDFDKTFPGFRTEQMTLVIQNASPAQIEQITQEADAISGFTGSWTPRTATDEGTRDPNVTVIQNGLQVRNDAPKKIAELRQIQPPKGSSIWVGGTPALEQDSIHSLLDKGPLMLLILISTTTILIFLAFGSLVLPIKAALMSALTLGSTMGVLTWIFVDGHGSSFLNFTPTPLTAPVIGLIIAVIYGLSTDYEVFLVSRMVEARERGMSTAEAIRIGTATTGRIITAAALVLIVVAGAFAFSDLVMMKYLAFGLITALLLDATVIRMFLVPAVMKMLGDDCWWAPRWMKRLQVKIGLGETHRPDERKRPMTHERDDDAALVGAGAPVPPRTPHDPTHPDGPPRRAMPTRVPAAQDLPSGAGTTRIPTAHSAPADSDEAPTTRFSSAKNAVRSAVSNAAGAATAATHRQQAPATPEREIESWLGELRGKPGNPAPQPHSVPSADPTRSMPPAPGTEPSTDATTAIPTQRPNGTRTEDTSSATEAATRAIPIAKPRGSDTEAATEKLNSRAEGDKKNGEGDDKPTRRGGGGVSAQDLLRREGRI
ncbi:MAG: MMPL family transporter, partial [Mycobacterium sp.]